MRKLFILFVAIVATTALWASNTITYTATGKLSGYNGSLDVGKTTFGPAITSHEFVNGTGTITCDGEITMIGKEAFRNSSSLTSVTIPNSVTRIMDRGFHYCKSLTSIVIPNSVTSIGEGVFFDCYELASVILSDSITIIKDDVFFGCKSLTSITIPNTITTIGEYSFEGCGLTHIEIPTSVTSIEYRAFYGCSSLTSVTIPNSVTKIGMNAFNKVNNIVYYGTATGSPWGAKCMNGHVDGYLVYRDATKTKLCGCATIVTGGVTIPNSVTEIGISAFEWCIGLSSITIPNSVTTIGNYAFHNCSSLTSVTIPNSITEIEISTFSYCSSLTSVTIPNSIVTIGDDAFKYCSNLTSVTIPNSVTTIGNNAFEDCSGLTFITCYATNPPACNNGSFYKVNKSIPVYVPSYSVNIYKEAYQWKDFYDIRPITAQEVEVTEIEAEPTESTVEIAWPIVVDAETYTIEIHLGDKLIYSIVFNAQGQLLSINFNPAPSRGHTYATTAEGTATGWAYTIAGLNPGTNYTYSVVAKNISDQVIDTKNGSFATTAPTGLFDVKGGSDHTGINANKFLYNGQLIIRKNDNLYTATGAKVK